MASPAIFSMAPGMPSGRTDLFLPIIANRFLIMLIKGDLFLLELKICVVVLYSDKPCYLFSCHMKTALRKLGRAEH
jgi:hypothetical protein